MGLEKVEALQNLVVLDLTRVVAGPYAGSILGDFGAEVIKIEVPGKGDDARSYGPYRNGESVYYANLNRNKKGITLNLKTEEGKKIFLELVNKAVFEPSCSYSKQRENIYTPCNICPLVRGATPPKTLVSARADCTPSGHCSVGDF